MFTNEKIKCFEVVFFFMPIKFNLNTVCQNKETFLPSKINTRAKEMKEEKYWIKAAAERAYNHDLQRKCFIIAFIIYRLQCVYCHFTHFFPVSFSLFKIKKNISVSVKLHVFTSDFLNRAHIHTLLLLLFHLNSLVLFAQRVIVFAPAFCSLVFF